MSSADRVAHIDGQLAYDIMSNTHALPAEYKYPKSKQTKRSHLNVCTGFCFNNIFCAATNFDCIDGFSSANSRNEEMMGDGFLLLLSAAGFVLGTVNVC